MARQIALEDELAEAYRVDALRRRTAQRLRDGARKLVSELSSKQLMPWSFKQTIWSSYDGCWYFSFCSNQCMRRSLSRCGEG